MLPILTANVTELTAAIKPVRNENLIPASANLPIFSRTRVLRHHQLKSCRPLRSVLEAKKKKADSVGFFQERNDPPDVYDMIILILAHKRSAKAGIKFCDLIVKYSGSGCSITGIMVLQKSTICKMVQMSKSTCHEHSFFSPDVIPSLPAIALILSLASYSPFSASKSLTLPFLPKGRMERLPFLFCTRGL